MLTPRNARALVVVARAMLTVAPVPRPDDVDVEEGGDEDVAAEPAALEGTVYVVDVVGEEVGSKVAVGDVCVVVEDDDDEDMLVDSDVEADLDVDVDVEAEAEETIVVPPLAFHVTGFCVVLWSALKNTLRNSLVSP